MSTWGLAGNVANVDDSGWRKSISRGRIKFDDDAKQRYLDHYSEYGRKGQAAKCAGVHSHTVIEHMEMDPDFQMAVEEARGAYRDKVMEHAQTLIFEGVEVKRYTARGELIETRKEYPIRLIELELKRVEPGYREKQTLDLNTKGGVMVAPAEISPEDWIKQQEELNQSKGAPIIDVTPKGSAEETAIVPT